MKKKKKHCTCVKRRTLPSFVLKLNGIRKLSCGSHRTLIILTAIQKYSTIICYALSHFSMGASIGTLKTLSNIYIGRFAMWTLHKHLLTQWCECHITTTLYRTDAYAHNRIYTRRAFRTSTPQYHSTYQVDFPFSLFYTFKQLQ